MNQTESISACEERMLQIHGRYMLHFADQSRITRHVEILDELVPELESLARELEALGQDERVETLREQAKERLALYVGERELIQEVQVAGPMAVEVAVLMERAEIVRATYRRHYAGESRLTRDWLQLDGMVDDLVEIQQQLSTLSSGYGASEAVSGAVKTVTNELDLYRREVREIKAAQRDASGEKRFGMLATLANNQFALYRGHFAGHGRSSRRADRLELVISNLRLVFGNMKRLNQGELSDDVAATHRGNMETVSDRLDAYRIELEAVRDAQAGMDANDRVSSLEAEARRILGEYQTAFAGQDRRTRDMTLLTMLSDRMTDVESELREMTGAFSTLDLLTQAHTLATDALNLLNRERRKVADAQSGQSEGSD